MTTTPTLNVNGTIRALSVRLVHTWQGAWFADVDLDPDDATVAVAGAVTLGIGATTLSGTVDPRYSGRFVDGVRARIVAGGGGWDSSVASQFWANDAGVQNTTVYQATAALVGETVNVQTPAPLGLAVTRTAGPASRVFGDADWYVDLTGVTQVATRALVAPDASAQVLGYDASLGLLEVSSDAVVIPPGAQFTDTRFDGTLTARDVEQTFTKDGVRTQILCSTNASSRLVAALKNVAREFSGAKWLKLVEYRYVSSTGARLNLQAVNAEAGYPDALPVEVWPGMAGLSAQPTPSQGVLVAFINGDSTRPIVLGFDGNLPRTVSIDAVEAVHLVPSGSPSPIVRVGDAIQVELPAECPFTGVVGVPPATTPITGVVTFLNPAFGIAITGSAKGDCG